LSSVAHAKSCSSRGCIRRSTTGWGPSTFFSSLWAKTTTEYTTKRSSTDSGAQMREDRSCQRVAGITLRPIRPDDEGFLYDVYASTRLDELATLGWSEPQREAFLRMQFRAQHQSYLTQFPMADFAIILHHGRPIGRLYIERRADEMRGIDIALLPEYRRAGIGTTILRDLLAEAARDGKPFRIHVEKFNRAQRLYKRLGFTILDDDGAYLFMEWRPEAR
jgi:ribosomal protein S18 acetylase RimI-like enzyme